MAYPRSCFTPASRIHMKRAAVSGIAVAARDLGKARRSNFQEKQLLSRLVALGILPSQLHQPCLRRLLVGNKVLGRPMILGRATIHGRTLAVLVQLRNRNGLHRYQRDRLRRQHLRWSCRSTWSLLVSMLPTRQVLEPRPHRSRSWCYRSPRSQRRLQASQHQLRPGPRPSSCC